MSLRLWLDLGAGPHKEDKRFCVCVVERECVYICTRAQERISVSECECELVSERMKERQDV